ncbi:unnamed protein product [Cochlearia groenlandica]
MGKSFTVVAAVLLYFIPVSISIPFIVFHGIGDRCSGGVNNFTQVLSNLSGSPGFCLEIGNGERDSWFMPLMNQANLACEKVKQMKELSQGYNIVAQSQGNLVARGLIEFCDNAPPIFNYVSLGGPHAGIAAIPKCSAGPICAIGEALMKLEIYTDFVQDHYAPSGYIKIPTNIGNYLEHSTYLPKLNNERPNERNSTFKDRFTSLHNLVLVMFQSDKIVIPKESSWFGYYPDGASTPLLPPQETKLYTEDWIGLKTLDVAGKVKFVSVPGGHLKMAQDDAVKYVVPYLQNKPRMVSSEVILNFKTIFQQRVMLMFLCLFFFFFIPITISVPFILIHGFKGQCSNGEVSSFTRLLSNLSNTPGSCLEIGNGEQDSVSMPLTQQASIACEKVKQMKELSQGYNIVAQSQGNLVARGLIEFCDNAPPVFNYVSLGGPHAGIADIPTCTNPVCELLKTEAYTDYVQDHIAPSGYIKIPTNITNYLEHSKYLPKLNNERPDQRNSTFKDRFTNLHNLVLVMFQGDKVVIPKESCWFGYYPDGASTPLLPPRETRLYIEDWIGLKTLDVAGKVKFLSVPGDHLQMAQDDAVKYVVPYLQNKPTTVSSEVRLNFKTM